MSHNARVWAKRQQLGDSTTKHMLKTFADWAAEDYTAWVSNDELVRDTEMNHKTVRACTKRLIELGYLRDSGQRAGNTRQIVVYQITAPVGSVIVEARDRRTGTTETLSPPDLEEYEDSQKRKATEIGSLKAYLKRKPTENGSLPKTALKTTKNGSKDYQKRPERLPKTVPDRLDVLDKRERDAGASKTPPSLNEKKAEPSTVGTRLHPDWKPSAEQTEFAISTQPGWDSNRVTREGQKFRNHWLAVPGDRAFKTDWNAMWEKWVLSDDPMRSRSPVASGGAVTGDWWESDGGTDAQGASVNCPREKDEPTPKYLVRVAKASGRGPWIDFVLQQAKRSGSDKWFQQVVQYLGDGLMPPDFYAS